jgi:hypothetical protein
VATFVSWAPVGSHHPLDPCSSRVVPEPPEWDMSGDFPMSLQHPTIEYRTNVYSGFPKPLDPPGRHAAGAASFRACLLFRSLRERTISPGGLTAWTDDIQHPALNFNVAAVCF